MNTDKFVYGVKTGIKTGLLYSLITMACGIAFGVIISISSGLNTEGSINVLRVVLILAFQNNYFNGPFGLIISSNILILLIIWFVLYKMNKLLKYKYNKYTMLGYIISTAGVIALASSVVNQILMLLEANISGEKINFIGITLETISTLLRGFIQYSIIVSIGWAYGFKKTIVDTGYVALYTYIKYIVVAMFALAVIVEIDLFRFISVEGKVLGLGDIISSITFSGQTAALANCGLVISIGNVAAYILAICFGGKIVQYAEFAKQKEIYELGLGKILYGKLGGYSFFLFIAAIVTIVIILVVAVWKIEKEDFLKSSMIFIVGVVLTNVVLITISTFQVVFTKILRIGVKINVLPIMGVTILATIIAIGIRYISLKVKGKKEVAS